MNQIHEDELYLITFTTMPNIRNSKWRSKRDYEWFYEQIRDILERNKNATNRYESISDKPF